MSAIDSLKLLAGHVGEVGQWGHPFHGLVTAPGATFTGTGTLDHGGPSLKPYEMPGSADAWAIQFDGVPAVTRTPEQAAADAAAGYQWLQKVVVSGTGQVWGKDPGTISPQFFWRDATTGKVWRVRLNNTGKDPMKTHVEIEVREFGRFGAGSLAATTTTFAHSINILPDLILAYYEGAEAVSFPVIPMMHDIKPDGSGAIFSISGFLAGAANTNTDPDRGANEPAPFGFLEVTVASGPGGACVPSVTTLRTCAQTIGTASSTATSTPVETPVTISGTGAVISAGTLSSEVNESVTGRILSMFYSGAGVAEVTVGWSSAGTLTATQTVVDGGGGTWTQTTERIIDYSYSMSGSYGGTPFIAYSGAFSGNPVVVRVSGVDDPDGFPIPLTQSLASEQNKVFARYFAARGQIFDTTGNVAVRIQPHAYTARVFGYLRRDGGAGDFQFGTVQFPGGSAAGGASTTYISQPPVFRSFDPITGTLSARSSVPVCYV
ncbi:MAG: hypothetical protein KAX84_20760 [Burkholderiales bacterium]|nr:hypothetical protein [Burkholderiales bacterium]